jgi:hypothetical protein
MLLIEDNFGELFAVSHLVQIIGLSSSLATAGKEPD